MTKRDKSQKGQSQVSGKPQNSYPMLSVFQYIFAIGVLVVHSGSISPHPVLHFVTKSIWGRQAVPFFLIGTAYFLRKKTLQSATAEGDYWRKLFNTYCFWSVIYLPYAFFYVRGLGLPLYLLPVGLVVGFLYTGLCYQLWYIPALVQGAFLVKAGRRYLPRWGLLVILVSLYLFGSIETYTGYLQGTVLEDIYKAYARVFITSRNGLFYTPLFLYLGQILAEQEHHTFFTRHRGWKVLLSAVLLLAEAGLVYQHQGLDKNFFLTLPLFSLCLVNWCLHSSVRLPWSSRVLKDLSQICYFVHPLFIELSLYVLRQQVLPIWQQGQLVFLASLIGSHLVALLWLKNKRYKKNI